MSNKPDALKKLESLAKEECLRAQYIRAIREQVVLSGNKLFINK